MSKMKSNRGAAKTFRKTASGKIKRSKAFKSHILTSKSTKRKRGLRKSTMVSASEQKRITRLIQ